MATTITTPDMGLVLPVNLTDPTPDWGQRIMDAFTAVDSHDHSSGKGVQVTPAGIDINADLPFGSANATQLRSARFTAQGAPLALGSDVGCLYDSAGELWYNDGSAHQVQITQSGAVKSAPQALSIKSVTTSYTILAADPYQLFLCQTGTGAVAIALPSSAAVAPGRTYFFSDIPQNSAANAITIAPNGGDTINGINASVVIAFNGAMVMMTTDGAGKWTLNTMPIYAPGSVSSTVAITTGTVTLTAAQLQKQIIQFTGTLSGAVVVVLPNAPGSYTLDFSQVVVGAFSVAVKSGTTTSTTLSSSFVGSTQLIAQITPVLTYGGNTVRILA